MNKAEFSNVFKRLALDFGQKIPVSVSRIINPVRGRFGFLCLALLFLAIIGWAEPGGFANASDSGLTIAYARVLRPKPGILVLAVRPIAEVSDVADLSKDGARGGARDTARGSPYEKAAEIYRNTPTKSTALKAMVTISGEFLRPGWRLRHDKKLVNIDNPELGTFSYTFALLDNAVTGKNFKIVLEAVSKDKPTETETLECELVYEKPESLEDLSVNRSRRRLSAIMGASAMTYTETGTEKFSEVALTAGAQADYVWVPSALVLSWNAKIDVLPLWATQSKRSSRLFQSQALIKLTVSLFGSALRFGINAGANYSTMFVSDSSFGYHNLILPQAFPSLFLRLSQGSSIEAFFSFMPAGTSFQTAGGEREIKAGLQFSKDIGKKYRSITQLNYASLNFAPIAAATIQSSSVSLLESFVF